MKAVVHDRFGMTEVLRIADTERPDLVDDGVLVRVRAASVNPADWYEMAGRPYVGRPAFGLRRPRQPALGGDFAGTVEEVGKDVAGLRPGDEVFGARSGALAEYVCVRVGVAKKPVNLNFEEAAAVPIAAVTALQALRDKGRFEEGQRVLVNGASGGVGTFAVQLAKAFGAEVTGVCSAGKVELVRSLGADEVVDYTRDDFSRRRSSLRPDPRHRGQPRLVGVQARPRPRRDARRRRRLEGEPPARAARARRQDPARVGARQPQGRLLHREGHAP